MDTEAGAERPPPPAPRPRSRAGRQAENAEYDFTTVKCCWGYGQRRGFCKIAEIDDMICRAVPAVTRLRFETKTFLRVFVDWCRQRGLPASHYDFTGSNALDPFIRLVATGKLRGNGGRLAAIKECYDTHWLPLRRESAPDYQPPSMPRAMSQLVSTEREAMATSIRTMAERTFVSRIERFYRLDVRDAFGPLEGGLADSKACDAGWKVVKSILVADEGADWGTFEVRDVIASGRERGWFGALEGLPATQLDYLQGFVDYVGAALGAIGPVPVSKTHVARAYHAYIGFLLDVLAPLERRADQMASEAVEKSEKKGDEKRRRRLKLTYAVLPEPSLAAAAYVQVCPTLLKSMLGSIKATTQEASRRQWAEDLLGADVTDKQRFEACFDMRRVGVREGRPWQFASRVATDGVGVSVLLRKLKPRHVVDRLRRGRELGRAVRTAKTAEDDDAAARASEALRGEKKKAKAAEAEEAEEVAERIRARFQCGYFSCLLGLDPGDNAQTVALMPADAQDCAAYAQGRPGQLRHQTRSVSAAEFRDLTGTTRRSKLTEERRRADDRIRQFEKLQGSFKTSDPGRFMDRCRQYFAAVPTLMEFYVTRKFFRRLRFDTFVRGQRGRQKTIDKLLGVRTAVVASDRGTREVLLKQPGQEKDILVGLGTGHTVFNKALDAELRRRATVVGVNEYRTSKYSSRTHLPLRGMPLSTTKALCYETRLTRGQHPAHAVGAAAGTGKSLPPRLQLTRHPVREYNITVPLMEGKRRKSSFTVRTAQQPSGQRERWNRDVNASIWIVYKLWLKMRDAENELPAIMRSPAAAAA